MQLPNISMHSALKSQNQNILVLSNLISVHDRKKKKTAKESFQFTLYRLSKIYSLCTLNSTHHLEQVE